MYIMNRYIYRRFFAFEEILRNVQRVNIKCKNDLLREKRNEDKNSQNSKNSKISNSKNSNISNMNIYKSLYK